MIVFKKIYIEVTNSCNLACRFCQRTGRPKALLTPAAFAEILAKIKAHTGFIALHVLGEPLLHPAFEQLLAISRTHGLRVTLTTNGTLLARHRPVLLTAPALRQINFSLHGLAQVESGAAESSLREIIDFAREASRATQLYLSLRLWNLQACDVSEAVAWNDHVLARLAEAVAWNDHVLARLAEAFDVPSLRAADLAASRGLPLAPRVFLNPENQFAWPHPSAPELGRHGYCRGLRDHLAILADGTVVPCCLDAGGLLALGNIFQQSLAEIVAGPRARRMREGFAQQKLLEPLCRRCTYRLRFASGAKS